MGGERCCSDSDFDEDRRKLVEKILQQEKKAHESIDSSSDFPVGDFSSDNRWKTGMIICVAIIITACLICCIADLVFNICTCFQRCYPLLYDHKDGNKIVEAELEQPDQSSNKRGSGYTSSNLIQESVIPEEIQMEEGSDTSEQNDARGESRTAVIKDLNSVSSSPENRPDKSLTLTKRELQLLRSECFKLFHEDEKLNLSLQEPTFESQSTNNLSPSKRIRKCSENNNERNCQSCRTSPVLTERKSHSAMNNQMRVATLNRLGGAIPKSSSLKFSTLQPANRDIIRGQNTTMQQNQFCDFDEREQITVDNRGHNGLLMSGPRIGYGSSHHVVSPLALTDVPSSVARVNFHSLSPSRECMEADC